MDFSIGDQVYLVSSLPYLKTADSMPMLRPPDLVSQEEVGVVVGLVGKESIKVRFRRGVFLISMSDLKKTAG